MFVFLLSCGPEDEQPAEPSASAVPVEPDEVPLPKPMTDEMVLSQWTDRTTSYEVARGCLFIDVPSK